MSTAATLPPYNSYHAMPLASSRPIPGDYTLDVPEDIIVLYERYLRIKQIRYEFVYQNATILTAVEKFLVMYENMCPDTVAVFEDRMRACGCGAPVTYSVLKALVAAIQPRPASMQNSKLRATVTETRVGLGSVHVRLLDSAKPLETLRVSLHYLSLCPGFEQGSLRKPGMARLNEPVFTVDAYASPWNYQAKRWYSMVPTLDAPFGSLGRAHDIVLFRGDIVLAHPPDCLAMRAIGEMLTLLRWYADTTVIFRLSRNANEVAHETLRNAPEFVQVNEAPRMSSLIVNSPYGCKMHGMAYTWVEYRLVSRIRE